ncbi:S8 family serine peptidase [Tropicibacter sp. S64]|uniref:S8 family serine peptidase n=1 Tax=Tropicibacter sp. S64 TaxID=3415122 RepID=UPI003C7BBA91
MPGLRPLSPSAPDQPGDPEIRVISLTPPEVAELEKDPGFLALTPAMPTRQIAPEPMDEVRSDDLVPGWGINAVGADRTQRTGRGARIALLDTGIDARHPCFRKLSLTTRDFVGTGLEDVNGHGTHLAGTVLGRDMGGVRIGVARGMTSLIVAKALSDAGQGTSDGFLRALLWAYEQGAQAVGFALSYDTTAQIEAFQDQGYPLPLATQEAVHAHRGNLRVVEHLLRLMDPARRPLIVAAVGNDSLRTISPQFDSGPSSPAAARGVLTVGALGPGEAGLTPAPFSNRGPFLTAPGVGIISASAGDGVRSLNGSSMAMAHALGVAALWIEKLQEAGEPVTAETLGTALMGSATLEGLAPGLGMFDRGEGLVRVPRSSLD